jgi:hypothetical protein
VLSAEAAHLQPGDAFCIEALDLLGHEAHGEQSLERRCALHEPEQRLGAHAPHGSVLLGTEHAHQTGGIGVIGDDDERRRAATLALAVRGAKLRLVERSGSGVLDAVHDLAGGNAVTVAPGRLAAGQRGDGGKQFSRVHRAQQAGAGMPRG